MSENITSLTHEQLVQEVYTLQDQYVRMKKMYEDLFYNLDYDNFSANLKIDMQNFKLTFSEVFPDGSKGESGLSINAREIKTWVSEEYQSISEAGEQYRLLQSSITQTAVSITSVVSATYETKGAAEYQYAHLQSSITQTAESITSVVSATYQTQTDAGSQYADLRSSITQTANSIRSEVYANYGTRAEMSLIEQTANKINLLVASGDSYSNFTLTDRTAELVSKSIHFNGVVKFTNDGKYPSADGSNITEIDGGKLKAYSVTANAISAGAITAEKISNNYVYAGTIEWKNVIAPQVNLILRTHYHRALEVNQNGAVTNIAEFNKGLGEAVQNIYDSLSSIQTALRTARITN